MRNSHCGDHDAESQCPFFLDKFATQVRTRARASNTCLQERRSGVFLEQIHPPHVAAQRVQRLVPADLSLNSDAPAVAGTSVHLPFGYLRQVLSLGLQ